MGELKSSGKSFEISIIMAQHKTYDDELVQWRVRLYCGHTVMTSRHCTAEDPTVGASSMRCPTCGMDPALLVAYEPVDPDPQRPDDTGAVVSAPPKRQTVRSSKRA
ncbi:hypothetical protein [Nocardia arizonensis]|uniref:hypothetical protein n=1 Tax=Nocardia arizonensis TaxID=1141647 RepID=UPI0012E21E47|nr:hypothetical protein [Nocardia arizonensis]